MKSSSTKKSMKTFRFRLNKISKKDISQIFFSIAALIIILITLMAAFR